MMSRLLRTVYLKKFFFYPAHKLQNLSHAEVKITSLGCLKRVLNSHLSLAINYDRPHYMQIQSVSIPVAGKEHCEKWTAGSDGPSCSDSARIIACSLGEYNI